MQPNTFRACLWVLAAVFAVGWALSVAQEIRGGRPWGGLSISGARGPDDYPVVVAHMNTSFVPEENALEPGDRLLRIGASDARGMGILRMRTAYRTAQALVAGALEVSVRYMRGGSERDVRVRVGLNPISAPMLGVVLAVFAASLLVGLRATSSVSARTLALAASFWSMGSLGSSGSDLELHVSLVVFFATPALAFPLLMRFFLLFPEDAPRPARWALRATWLAQPTLPFFVSSFWPAILSPAIGFPAGILVMAACNLLGLGILVRNYIRSGPIGRRQAKWVLFPLVITLACYVVAQVLVARNPEESAPFFLYLSAVLVPIGIVIAILRFNLFDIDRILSAAATYGVLLVVLAGGALALLPSVAAWVAPAIGAAPSTVHIGLSAALAMVLLPAQRWVRPRVDGLFFRERVALERGIDSLLHTLGGSEGPRELLETAGEQLEALLRPDACVVYARTGPAFSAVLARGRAIPHGFEAESALVGALASRSGPLARERWTRGAGEGLDPFARAALETLGAEVVLPLRQGERLSGFICLGTKRSGDIYTSTDLSLLSAVADKVSAVITRFDEAETLREKEAMRQALRRYVPAAIASRVELGQSLEPEERDVSVLFTDIRDYTGFAEGRASREIFEAVNRYAEKVSGIVQSHGGNVVEFEGDGIMAVFGAPNQLPAKERAALDAGREIVAAVPTLGLGTEHGAGVGIATGEALVGNVQAADRLIWSAIGNTTNLAARLQGLTRHLDAEIVIDTATRDAVESGAHDFERQDHVRIRGRVLPETVYALRR